MKQLFYIILCVFFINVCFSQTGTVIVKINGITNTKGGIEIGLYNKKESFPIYTENFKGASITPSKSGVTYTFKNVPIGTYAIAAFHDENENKKIDKNWFGIPTEHYGFSLNKYGKLGPPDFNDVSFKITKGNTKTLTINLK